MVDNLKTIQSDRKSNKIVIKIDFISFGIEQIWSKIDKKIENWSKKDRQRESFIEQRREELSCFCWVGPEVLRRVRVRPPARSTCRSGKLIQGEPGPRPKHVQQKQNESGLVIMDLFWTSLIGLIEIVKFGEFFTSWTNIVRRLIGSLLTNTKGINS